MKKHALDQLKIISIQISGKDLKLEYKSKSIIKNIYTKLKEISQKKINKWPINAGKDNPYH